jgi:hypothetical protein
VDQTARAGVDYVAVNASYTLGNNTTKLSIPIKILNNTTYQGTRTFAVRLTCTRNCALPASYTPAKITIQDDELPPPPSTVTWTHCANQGEVCAVSGTADVRYGVPGHYYIRNVTGSVLCDVGPFGGDPIVGTLKTCDSNAPVPIGSPPLTSAPPCYVYDFATQKQVPLAGSTCPARTCPGYPNPVPWQSPCPAVTAWLPAPLQVDGYARLRNGPNLIVRLVATGITTDADPALRTHWWVTQFQQDVSGNYPSTNPYWKDHIAFNYNAGLEGVVPAP